jgi:hypothetical protein
MVSHHQRPWHYFQATLVWTQARRQWHRQARQTRQGASSLGSLPYWPSAAVAVSAVQAAVVAT